LHKQLDGDENDLLREMVREFPQRLMAAGIDALTGAGWGEQSPERVNYRNRYRQRPLDTRARHSSGSSSAPASTRSSAPSEPVAGPGLQPARRPHPNRRLEERRSVEDCNVNAHVEKPLDPQGRR
jgi:hypothetical protein